MLYIHSSITKKLICKLGPYDIKLRTWLKANKCKIVANNGAIKYVESV